MSLVKTRFRFTNHNIYFFRLSYKKGMVHSRGRW